MMLYIILWKSPGHHGEVSVMNTKKKRGTVLVVTFSYFLNAQLCDDAAMSDLVHDVKAIHGLC